MTMLVIAMTSSQMCVPGEERTQARTGRAGSGVRRVPGP